MLISSILKNWYLQKKRNLPWRESPTPYNIWISEVILQQTRVAQGTDYYIKFIERFPDVISLAEAPELDVLKVWQGLGYYTRARNLHTGAKQIVGNYHGHLPGDYNQLLSIKGIGPYTASAIGSIAFGLSKAVVDGNVNRVISRLFGVHEPVNSKAGISRIRQFAEDILDINDPGTHNQAVMEFGAMQCIITQPDCAVCPLNHLCYSYKHELVDLLPVKSSRPKSRLRFLNYLVVISGNGTYLYKREANDIWQGLFEFPMIESDEMTSIDELIEQHPWKSLFKNKISLPPAQVFKEKPHILSHQKIIATFFIVMATEEIFTDDTCFFVEKVDVRNYPVSRLIGKFLNRFDFNS